MTTSFFFLTPKLNLERSKVEVVGVVVVRIDAGHVVSESLRKKWNDKQVNKPKKIGEVFSSFFSFFFFLLLLQLPPGVVAGLEDVAEVRADDKLRVVHAKVAHAGNGGVCQHVLAHHHRAAVRVRLFAAQERKKMDE